MSADEQMMAGIAGPDNQPIRRDDYAAHLRESLERDDRGARVPLLSATEGTVVAELLDELAALYPGEALGSLSREVAVRLWNRLGI